MSGQTRWKAAAVSLALAVVACQPELTVEEDRTLQSVTTPSVTESTVTTSPTAPTSTATPEGDFVVTPCGEVSEALVCEAYELIQRHYLDAVEPEQLAEGALSALASGEIPSGDGVEICPLPSDEFIEVCAAIDDGGFEPEAAFETVVAGMAFLALDPNSGYYDAETLDLIEEEQSGKVEGIGAIVATEEEGQADDNTCQVISDSCRLKIVSTIEDGPAREADLQPDDEFLRVDGKPIEGLSVDEVTAMVKGPAGTEVELTFLRAGEEFTISITREAVQIPVVQSETVGKVAYIRLNVFTDNGDEQLRRELEELLDAGAATIVLDLRNNPGGLLETAIAVTSEFIDDGVVVSTESPESVTPYFVEPGGVATDPSIPVYVLVNQGSASASEVVAGALADAGRATIVGENTFGKNTVQQRFPLSNGGALKLTIARWLTPEGHDFGGTGITPDVEVALPESLTASEVVEVVTDTTT